MCIVAQPDGIPILNPGSWFLLASVWDLALSRIKHTIIMAPQIQNRSRLLDPIRDRKLVGKGGRRNFDDDDDDGVFRKHVGVPLEQICNLMR